MQRSPTFGIVYVKVSEPQFTIYEVGIKKQLMGWWEYEIDHVEPLATYVGHVRCTCINVLESESYFGYVT